MAVNLALKVAGFLVGTFASYQTVACLVKPGDIMSHSVVKRAEISGESGDLTLFDFTIPEADINGWIESSDTVRQQGMSKAVITLQHTQLFKRAIFFALLNPQPNGAGFAGVRHPVEYDLSSHSNIRLKVRGQGHHKTFKITLKHHNEIGDGSPSYEQFFIAPNATEVVDLPIIEFKPYWRGQYIPDAAPLDISKITSFGIQFFGGVYEEQKQSGPATLEIDWIKATL